MTQHVTIMPNRWLSQTDCLVVSRAKRGKGKRKGTEESSPRISISFNSRVLRVEEGEAPLRVRFEPPMPPPKAEL